MVDKASLSDSTLIRASSGPGSTIFEGVGEEGGEEGIDSRGRDVRKFMVTRLDVGSASGCSSSDGSRVGVEGGGSTSALGLESRSDIESGTISVSRAVSTDLLRDPPRDTRCRFREPCSVTSSKGFGRPEQGSEEIARSREASSIWQERKATGIEGCDERWKPPRLSSSKASEEGWHSVGECHRRWIGVSEELETRQACGGVSGG